MADLPKIVTVRGADASNAVAVDTATVAVDGLRDGSEQRVAPAPIPTILRPVPAPVHNLQPADGGLPHLRALPVKEFLVGRSHVVIVVLSAVAAIMFMSSWGAAAAVENDGKLHRRYAASIIAFLFQILTTVLVIVILRTQPALWVLYLVELLAILTLFLTAVAMGMNDVVVDLCTQNKVPAGQTILCPAHTAEFFACFFVCIAMMLVFAATQQRAAMLIDKGILMGIRGRMTQL